jgi:hypothetical protein
MRRAFLHRNFITSSWCGTRKEVVYLYRRNARSNEIENKVERSDFHTNKIKRGLLLRRKKPFVSFYLNETRLITGRKERSGETGAPINLIRVKCLPLVALRSANRWKTRGVNENKFVEELDAVPFTRHSGFVQEALKKEVQAQ